MHQIFNSIEEDNFQLFSDLINQHPEYLNEIDKDGWSLLSLVTHYEMPEFVQFLLEQMTSEQINSQTPYHPLFIAFENNSSLVDILIKDPKIDLTIISKSGDNLLYYADYFQRTDLSPYIINAGVSPFAVNKTEQSAILYAIEHGNQNLFDLYTQNPDFSSYYEESWVKKAIKHNQVFIFKQLQPHSNLSSDELFNLAIGFEHIQIADLVLDNGDLIPGQQQVTAIVELMCKKYDNNEDQTAALRLADYLFNTKVPFNKFINSQGQSAWMLAVYNDNETIFEKLINCSNETVNISDNEQHTPLFYAIEKHNLNFVTSILARGANVNHVDNNKNTPLIQAVRYGLDDIVLAILKYPTVLVNEVNSNHDTALSLALQHKKIDIVSALIWAGGEITKNPVKFIEETSIYQIGLSGNYEKAYENTEEKQIDSFMALHKLGLKLDQVNKKGDTFLLHFIKNGYLANFKALLKCTFDVNQIDSEGNSALMCAMKKNSDEYALALLFKYNNLDFNIINKEGENIYDIAAISNSPKKVSSLLVNDDNLTKDKIQKVLPILAISGKLENDYEVISSLYSNIDTFIDSNKNNVLMLSIIGNNIDNFIWLLSQPNFKFDFLTMNKKNENITDIINKLSENDALLFTQALTPYIKTQRKLI